MLHIRAAGALMQQHACSVETALLRSRVHLPSAPSMPAAANMAVVSGSSVALTPPTTPPLPVFSTSFRAACAATRDDEHAVSAGQDSARHCECRLQRWCSHPSSAGELLQELFPATIHGWVLMQAQQHLGGCTAWSEVHIQARRQLGGFKELHTVCDGGSLETQVV